LVKTTKFKDPKYVGDPINAVRIFNTKEVDELIFLDITATPNNKEPNFKIVAEIASECFMPFGYGGGITSIDHVNKLIKLGAEKVILNSALHQTPSLIEEAAKLYGNQSIVVSIDIKRNLFGKPEVYTKCGQLKVKESPEETAKRAESLGAGEIFINSIDRDGTGSGYDLDLIKRVSSAVNVPVVACGGAGKVSDFVSAVKEGGASAVAAGNMFVFHGKHKAVLITYPSYSELEAALK
jgi:cyclase